MNNLVVRKSGLPTIKQNENLDNMHSRTGFGGMVDTSSSYFQQNRHSMYTQQVGYGSVPGWCHTGGVGIVIIFLCVTNIPSDTHLNHAT